MTNVISLIIGIIALPLVVLAFFPFLGWANWIIVAFAILGAGIGALSPIKTGRNLNLFVIVVGIIRLMMGGGII